MSPSTKKPTAAKKEQPRYTEHEGGAQMPQDEQVQRLVEAHRLLFRGKPPRIASDLPPGWYDLVDRLCSEIESELGEQASHLRVLQIKQKFGGLRFYWSWRRRSTVSVDILSTSGHVRLKTSARGEASARIGVLVSAAEAESVRTCELCGAPAKLRRSRTGWWRVRCDHHGRTAG